MTWTAERWVVLDYPEYKFEVEELRGDSGEQMIFVHLDVREWSKSTLKRLLKEFRVFRELQDVPLYATSPTPDEKWKAFVSLFGFKPLFETEQNTTYISIKGNKNGQSRNEQNQPSTV
jgi:hypothetical protein